MAQGRSRKPAEKKPSPKPSRPPVVKNPKGNPVIKQSQTEFKKGIGTVYKGTNKPVNGAVEVQKKNSVTSTDGIAFYKKGKNVTVGPKSKRVDYSREEMRWMLGYNTNATPPKSTKRKSK